jgi:hypothetical protein
MASDPSFARARELYLAHDGSRFYMSRNGVEHEYLSYGVPLEVRIAVASGTGGGKDRKAKSTRQLDDHELPVPPQRHRIPQ